MIYLILYLLSCILLWNTTRLLFKYNWYNINPNLIDFILVFIPFYNTAMGIFGLFIVDFPKKHNSKVETTYKWISKFFMLNKTK